MSRVMITFLVSNCGIIELTEVKDMKTVLKIVASYLQYHFVSTTKLWSSLIYGPPLSPIPKYSISYQDNWRKTFTKTLFIFLRHTNAGIRPSVKFTIDDIMPSNHYNTHSFPTTHPISPKCSPHLFLSLYHSPSFLSTL